MKTSLTCHKFFLGLASAVLLLLSVSAANAQILLTVNISNPSAVTITATGTDSLANVEADMADGIDLLGFFKGSTGPVSFTVNSGSSLTPGTGSAGTVTYDESLSDVLSTGSNIDLNLYSDRSAPENFSTTDAAFTGTLTINLSGVASDLLPSAGVGDIKTGFFGSASPNTYIGQYQVVTSSVAAPEPSAWALLFVGLTLLAICRPRLKALGLSGAKSAC